MTLSSPRRLATTLTVAAVAAVVLSGCGGAGDHSSMPGMSTGPASPGAPSASAASAAPGDVTFAQMMIPHHEQAVTMAEMALQDRAKASPEVVQLATDIAKAQGPEIETMTTWLASWGAPESMGMDHSMPGMMGQDEMQDLSTATGAEFDRAWLTAMVAHHEGAVTMAGEVLATTEDDAVRTLAQAIVDGQEKEIATMKDLLQ